MTSKRLSLLLIGLIALLTIGLVGGTYGANSLLKSRAQKLLSLKAQSAALQQEQQSLKTAQKELSAYADLEKIAKSVVPEDKDQAEAVREIVNIAANNGVNLASISFPASTLGTSPSGTTVSPTGAISATSSSSAASSASKTSALSQLAPVKTIQGVYTLQISVASDTTKPVAYNKFISFLADLERNRRTAQVNTIALNPDKTNPDLISFTLGVSEYIKP